MTVHKFTCSNCKLDKTHESDTTTGYGVSEDGSKVCFDCCGLLDAERMTETGRGVLYLITERDQKSNYPIDLFSRPVKLTNWPGTLEFRVLHYHRGDHNWTGRNSRIDVWFIGPDKEIWTGYQIGHWTQLTHCRKTSGKSGVSKYVNDYVLRR
jgi:hypothetical protein